MTRFEAFLDELDERWTTTLPDRLPFRVIGSTALFLQTAYERRTKDGDVLRAERDGFDATVCTELNRLAVMKSKLFSRHGIYLDLVHSSLPYLPMDVSQMIACGVLVHSRFVERFRSMIERNGFDARAEDLLPLMVERLHEVESDLFALDHVTAVDLPSWITG